MLSQESDFPLAISRRQLIYVSCVARKEANAHDNYGSIVLLQYHSSQCSNTQRGDLG
jgi:hypothetical protein